MAFYNFAIIKWGTGSGSEKVRSSKLWHFLGWSVRALPAIFIVWLFWGEWLQIIGFCLLYVHLAWTLYDGVLNWTRGLNFFYQGSHQSGTGSWIDRHLKKNAILFIKLGLFILTIIFWVAHFNDIV
jgi:hypothetical protein